MKINWMMNSIQIQNPSTCHKFKQQKNNKSIKMAEKNYGDSVQTSFRHHSNMVQTSLRQHPNIIQMSLTHHSDIIQTKSRQHKNNKSIKHHKNSSKKSCKYGSNISWTWSKHHSVITTSCNTKHNHKSSSSYGVPAKPLRMPCEAVTKPQKTTNHHVPKGKPMMTQRWKIIILHLWLWRKRQGETMAKKWICQKNKLWVQIFLIWQKTNKNQWKQIIKMEEKNHGDNANIFQTSSTHGSDIT